MMRWTLDDLRAVESARQKHESGGVVRDLDGRYYWVDLAAAELVGTDKRSAGEEMCRRIDHLI